MPNESKSSELSDPICQNGIPLHKKKIEWKEYRFSDFVEINPSVKIPKDVPVPFVEMKDLNSLERYCVSSQTRMLGGGSCFCNGDTLFARITPCLENGKICQVRGLKNGYGFGSTEFHVFRGREGISDSDFVYYLSKTDDVRSHAEINLEGTSGRQRVSKEAFDNLYLSLPPLSEQKRIASILSSLDDKIDLLHRENATLEAMAETLFRHHFIENPNPDWKEGVIADVIDFNPPRKLGKGEFAPFLEMSNLSADVYAPIAWRDRAFGSGTKFINGDTLLARITPCLENGKAAYIDFLDSTQVGWGSTEYIVMRPKRKIHPFFAYIIAKYQDFRDYAESCMSGSSGRQRVDVDNLKTYRFCIPDAIAVEQFNRNIVFLVGKMANNNNEIRCLKSLSNVLLPRLMSNMSLSL